MKNYMTLLLAAGVISCSGPAVADSVGRAITLEIRTDHGRTLPFYPAPHRGAHSRVYAEAVKGEHYRLVVRNNLNRRVGVVIAVDGRNIISGGQSWLGNRERMYILEPYGTAEYSGWRTGQDRVNRFYFTEAADSYAAAFKDESAMGVIALAAYPEVLRLPPPRKWNLFKESEPSRSRGIGSSQAPAAPSCEADSLSSQAEQKREAGTGYGREEYSPSVAVAFEPEAYAYEKTFIKYEWRETLYRLGVLRTQPQQPPRNRLWDDFAPPPPRY
jgi:hypothetical protein